MTPREQLFLQSGPGIDWSLNDYALRGQVECRGNHVGAEYIRPYISLESAKARITWAIHDAIDEWLDA